MANFLLNGYLLRSDPNKPHGQDDRRFRPGRAAARFETDESMLLLAISYMHAASKYTLRCSLSVTMRYPQ